MPPSSHSSGNLQRRNRPSVPRRVGMRKWMEHLLDHQLCHGLEWEDKPKKIFSIVWKHASSHGFDHSKHADVFMQWARYKGRTVKEERPQKKKKDGNYDSKHKSNFRCALHSLIDCVEISGEDDGPKKFFQFLAPTDQRYKERRDKKRNSYNKKAQKRTHDGKFSEEQKTAQSINLKKNELKERCKTDDSEITTLQKTPFGFHKEENMSVFKDIKANDSNFSEGQNTAFNVDVAKSEPKERPESNDNEMSTLQETDFGTAFGEVQNTIEILTENPHQLSGQSVQILSGQSVQALPHPAFSHDLGNIAVPYITVLSEEPTGQVKIIYGENQESSSSSSLPNFEALGVKDVYGPKTYMTSSLLACGGDMKVKKVTEEATQFVQQISMELTQTNNINPEFVLTNPSEEDIQAFLNITSENSSQDTSTDASNMMLIPQDQVQFDIPFPQDTDDGSLINMSNNILNDIDNDVPLPENMGFGAASDLDLPFVDSY